MFAINRFALAGIDILIKNMARDFKNHTKKKYDHAWDRTRDPQITMRVHYQSATHSLVIGARNIVYKNYN